MKSVAQAGHITEMKPVGCQIGYALETDIAVYIDGKYTKCYKVGKNIVINLNDFDGIAFGNGGDDPNSDKYIEDKRDVNYVLTNKEGNALGWYRTYLMICSLAGLDVFPPDGKDPFARGIGTCMPIVIDGELKYVQFMFAYPEEVDGEDTIL